MRFRQIDLLLLVSLLLGALFTSGGGAWAAPGVCVYAKGGSGIGGTGTVAEGTGMGGTGVRPHGESNTMQLAGNVILSQGTVEAQSNGRSRLLHKGDPVCEAETIVTSQSGMAQIRMSDDGFIAVRPETKLKIEKFVFGGTNKDSSMMALFKGACRFVTGKIGKEYPQNDLIKTPTALIGVRGTDHEATVILPGENKAYAAGTYDKVNFGVTFIKTDKGVIDIHPDQVGFAAKVGELPILLKEIPGFYNATPSTRHEGNPSEKENKGKELGENRREDKALGRSGEGSRPSNPSEGGTPSKELPDNRNIGIERPESPAHPELPETQTAPEQLEAPNTPEPPEIPSLPEPPEIPSLPEPPEPPPATEQP